jgi:hypothetical protein
MSATPPEITYDVFISYSHRDKTWVRGELLPRLDSAGLKVCVDYRDFRVGAPIVREMERAVLTSRHMIAVLTPAYLDSVWTDFEALMITTLDPGSRKVRLLPLLLEPCELPIHFNYLIYADFAAPDDRALSWQRLLDALAAPADPGGQPAAARPTQNSSTPVSRLTLHALGQPAPASEFNTAVVRELLLATFSDEELTTFCFDYYQLVHEGFSSGMSRTKKVQELVEHCARRGQMEPLLTRVEQVNAYQYARFEDRLRNAQLQPPKWPGPKPAVVPVPANPFGDTLAIRDAERFIGRETELRRLQTLLAGGSVALQGEAKIGKSSLLWRLAHTWAGKVLGPLDCQCLADRDDFHEWLAEEVDAETSDWRVLRKALNRSQALLLVDEMDAGPRHGLTSEDSEFLRSTCDKNRGFKIVAVSRKPLREAFPDSGSSPLFNILVPLTLCAMPDDESRLLLSHPWAPGTPPFDAATIDQLLKLADGHPFKLHRAAFHRHESLADPTYDWLPAYRQDLENLL